MFEGPRWCILYEDPCFCMRISIQLKLKQTCTRCKFIYLFHRKKILKWTWDLAVVLWANIIEKHELSDIKRACWEIDRFFFSCWVWSSVKHLMFRVNHKWLIAIVNSFFVPHLIGQVLICVYIVVTMKWVTISFLNMQFVNFLHWFLCDEPVNQLFKYAVC